MVRSLADAPHVTTLFEADLTRVPSTTPCTQGFDQKHAVDADPYHQPAARTCSAGKSRHCKTPCSAAERGIGVARAETRDDRPVIHRAQALSLFDIARRLNTLVESARAGRLEPQDVRGGTFTISNHGVGGSLLATPIVINQPQVAILGVGKVQRRVCVIEAGGSESIAVRSMCYLTLTIDHRALDAFQANAFLKLVVETLEQWPDAAEPLHD
jgi:2-oxoglutarate dehydrogenase E2 component (dihydrolipoamide succinyltransferase)